jgi:hypothetical protein
VYRRRVRVYLRAAALLRGRNGGVTNPYERRRAARKNMTRRRERRRQGLSSEDDDDDDDDDGDDNSEFNNGTDKYGGRSVRDTASAFSSVGERDRVTPNALRREACLIVSVVDGVERRFHAAVAFVVAVMRQLATHAAVGRRRERLAALATQLDFNGFYSNYAR